MVRKSSHRRRSSKTAKRRSSSRRSPRSLFGGSTSGMKCKRMMRRKSGVKRCAKYA